MMVQSMFPLKLMAASIESDHVPFEIQSKSHGNIKDPRIGSAHWFYDVVGLQNWEIDPISTM